MVLNNDEKLDSGPERQGHHTKYSLHKAHTYIDRHLNEKPEVQKFPLKQRMDEQDALSA